MHLDPLAALGCLYAVAFANVAIDTWHRFPEADRRVRRVFPLTRVVPAWLTLATRVGLSLATGLLSPVLLTVRAANAVARWWERRKGDGQH
jgi:hypothetical protein